jgi:protocatechuate 4,5-dioxygenase, alpha chain
VTAGGDVAVAQKKARPSTTRRGFPMSTQEPRGPVDVPGTPIFDGQTSRRGLRMNKMFMSFRDEANRTRFLADEVAYCQEYGLTPAQQEAVVDRDWSAMIDLGGSIFYVYKLAMMDGKSMQYLGRVFTGMTEEEFVAALRAGGRVDG